MHVQIGGSAIIGWLLPLHFPRVYFYCSTYSYCAIVQRLYISDRKKNYVVQYRYMFKTMFVNLMKLIILL